MALDGGEEWVWFRVGKEEALKYLPEGTEIAKPFGPRIWAQARRYCRNEYSYREIKQWCQYLSRLDIYRVILGAGTDCFLLGNRR